MKRVVTSTPMSRFLKGERGGETVYYRVNLLGVQLSCSYQLYSHHSRDIDRAAYKLESL